MDPRTVGVMACCPKDDCRSPEVRRIRRKGSFVYLQCKSCSHTWQELQDGVMVRGLVILPPAVLRIATGPIPRGKPR